MAAAIKQIMQHTNKKRIEVFASCLYVEEKTWPNPYGQKHTGDKQDTWLQMEF